MRQAHMVEYIGTKLNNPARVHYFNSTEEIKVLTKGITVTVHPRDVVDSLFYASTDGKFLTRWLDVEEFTDLVALCHRLNEWGNCHAS